MWLFSFFVVGVAGVYYDLTYYDALGVAASATPKEIKRAYYSLALESHPDRIMDPDLKKLKQEEFLEISQAYEIISDQDMRSKYDELVEYEVYKWDEKQYNIMRIEKENKFHARTGFRHSQSSFHSENVDTTFEFYASTLTLACIVIVSFFLWKNNILKKTSDKELRKNLAVAVKKTASKKAAREEQERLTKEISQRKKHEREKAMRLEELAAKREKLRRENEAIAFQRKKAKEHEALKKRFKANLEALQLPTGGLSCKDLDLVTSRLNFGQLRSLQEAVANEDLHETEKCELVQTWVTKIQNHNQEPTRKVQKAKQAANEVSWFHSCPRLAAPLICPSRFNISLCQRCKLFLFVQEYSGAVDFSKGNGKIPSWKQRVRTFIAIDSCAPNAKNGLQIFVQFFSRWSSVSKMVTGAKLGPPRSEKSVVAQSRLVGIRRTAVKAHQDKATAQVEEDIWSSLQQKALENALRSFGKAEDRWTKIAEQVPGKTKKQIVRRYKKIKLQILNAKNANAE